MCSLQAAAGVGVGAGVGVAEYVGWLPCVAVVAVGVRST